MHFITDEVEYGLAEFYHRFAKKMPQIVQVTQGYYGEVTQEVLDKSQVIRLHTVARQKRVLAKTTLQVQGQTKILGIPVNYEQVKMCVVDSKGHVGHEQFLADILRPKTTLPLTIQFPRDRTLQCGSRTIATSSLPPLEPVRIYYELSILGNIIYNQTMCPEVTSLPLNLWQVRVSVVTGITGAPDGLTWRAYQQMLDSQAEKRDYNKNYGNTEISEHKYHSCEDPGSNQEDGHCEQTAAAQYYNIGQPRVGDGLSQTFRPSTRPGGHTIAPEQIDAPLEHNATAPVNADIDYINLRAGPNEYIQTGENGGYINIRYRHYTQNSAPDDIASRSPEQTRNISNGVQSDSHSGPSTNCYGNETIHATHLDVINKRPLPAPPTTIAKPSGPRLQQSMVALSSQNMDKESVKQLSSQTTHYSTENKPIKPPLESGQERKHRRHERGKQTPPALPQRPQDNNKPLIRDHTYEHIIPRIHVAPLMKPTVEGLSAVPKTKPTASLNLPTKRFENQPNTVSINKTAEASNPHIDCPTKEQQRQSPCSYASAPDIASSIDQRHLVTKGRAQPITETDVNQRNTPATATKLQIKTGRMFGTRVSTPNETDATHSKGRDASSTTHVKTDTASEIKMSNHKGSIAKVTLDSPETCTSKLIDISKFRIDDVSEHLKMLGLGKYVDAFRAHRVDGRLMEVLDKDIFMSDFGMKTIEAIRLVKFIQTAHIPK